MIILLKATELWVEMGLERFGRAVGPDFAPSEIDDALLVRRRSFGTEQGSTPACRGRSVITSRRRDLPSSPRELWVEQR